MSLNPLDAQQAETCYRAGDVIMRQGDAGLCAYYILSGRVSVHRRAAAGHDLSVGSRGPGSIIGELAIVDDRPRSATVVALEDCVMLEISRQDFRRAVSSAHPVVQLITQIMVARYRDVLNRSDMLCRAVPDQASEREEQAIAASCNVVDALRMVRQFNLAISQGQLELHYQPIVSLADAQVRGVEALMRWRHPHQGYLPPAAFVPMAEESGLIIEATQWALREACMALSRIEKRFPGTPLFMSVNVSAIDVEHDGFAGSFERILTETGTDPARIHMEITESILIRPQSRVYEVLQYLSGLGIEVAIDDFGTGYSSLAYLQQFPITTLKIDKSFVQAINTQEESLGLVKSLLMLGENMGLNAIAEGVETEDQARALQRLGCDLMQGYYFARPMPESMLMDHLGNHHG